MLASFQLVWKSWKTKICKGANAHARGAFDNEQPTPWVAARTGFGEILFDSIGDQTTESTGNGSCRVIGGFGLLAIRIADDVFPNIPPTVAISSLLNHSEV